MSAVILNLADYRQQRSPVLGSPAQPRADVAAEVRSYCELLSLDPQQTAICVSVALRRAQETDARRAISAGKDRADRIFKLPDNEPPTGPRAA